MDSTEISHSMEIEAASARMKTGMDTTRANRDYHCRVHEVELQTHDPDEPKEPRNDVTLTWEDVWVMVSDKSKGVKPILQGVTGYARPGELLAIMGPSGCGKSTLLDALAGRLSSNTRQTGDILVNGCKQALAYGTSAYVMQDDVLIATLTVREAVYSLRCPKECFKMPHESRYPVDWNAMW